jgi:putative peptidoglycan lipid II flippase
MRRFFTSTIGGASLLILVVSIITKGFGFIREIIYANNFGLEWEFDIFLVSAALPMILYTTIIYLGQNYFIPAYNQTKANYPDKTRVFLTENLLMFFTIGLLLALFLLIFSDLILDFYIKDVKPEAEKTADIIFKMFCFTIPLSAAYSILGAFQNAEYNFHYPAFAKLLQNITVVLVLLLFTGFWNIYTIPVAFLAGMLVQLIYLLFKTGKHLVFGFYILKNFNYLKKVINSKLGLTIISEFLLLSFILIDRYFYYKLETGGIAALQYAYMLYILPVTTISFALSTTLFSRFSQTYSRFQKTELETAFRKGLKVILMTFAPILLIFIMDSEEIVRIVYQRGEFTKAGTFLTAGVLEVFSLSLIFYASFAIVNKLFYGTNMIKPLVILTVTGVLIKVILNAIFIETYLQEGLAYSTSISYSIMFIGGYYWTSARNKFKHKSFYWKDILFYLLNAVLSYLIVHLLFGLIEYESIFTFILRVVLFLGLFVSNLIYLKSSDLEIVNDLARKLSGKVNKE